MHTWCLGHYFPGTALFPFGRPGPLFRATNGTLLTDAILVDLMAMVSEGPGSVAPEVSAWRCRVWGCSEAGGAWRACLQVFSTCGGAVGRNRLSGDEAWSRVMIMGNRLLTLTWHSGMEWEGEMELVNILVVWSAMASCCDLKYELNPDA